MITQSHFTSVSCYGRCDLCKKMTAVALQSLINGEIKHPMYAHIFKLSGTIICWSCYQFEIQEQFYNPNLGVPHEVVDEPVVVDVMLDRHT